MHLHRNAVPPAPASGASLTRNVALGREAYASTVDAPVAPGGQIPAPNYAFDGNLSGAEFRSRSLDEDSDPFVSVDLGLVHLRYLVYRVVLYYHHIADPVSTVRLRSTEVRVGDAPVRGRNDLSSISLNAICWRLAGMASAAEQVR